jgi:hypothetical protein
VLFALFDLYQWALAYAADHFHNDFTFYFAAARVGLLDGWSSIYNLRLQQAQLDAIGSGIHVAELARFISPPPLAWLAAPFTTLPYPVAYWAWSALLLMALFFVWLLSAPSTGRVRVIFLVAALGWLPVIYALQLGQPALLVALGVAASYALLRAKQPLWAGIALGAIVFKPQLAFLVPVALLAARRYSAFIASMLTLGSLAAASALEIGTAGIADYASRLTFASSVPVNRELTLDALFSDLTVTRVVQALIAFWSLALVYRLRHRGPEWIFIPALVGGMLSTPYLHLDDLVILGLAAWLGLRAAVRGWTWAYALAAGVLIGAIEGEPVWGPAPVIAAELGALVLISVAALKHDYRDAEHHGT